MLADYHVHSNFSDDSWYPMVEICQDAIRHSLDEICFTDHVDYGIKPDVEQYQTGALIAPMHKNPQGMLEPALNVDYERYFPAIEKVQEQFADLGAGSTLGGLTVKAGLELGVQTRYIPQYQELTRTYASRMDFALLSVHQVNNLEFWTGEFMEGRTQDEYNQAYYAELLSVVENFKEYSVLAHLDLIKRYELELVGADGLYPFHKIRDIVAAILEQAISDGKGIELNTSSFRYGLPDLTPCTEILELYKDLGGCIITIGSDSHKENNLGAYIGLAKKRLLALGYKQYCTFNAWEPVFHTLDD
ncbi:histidinol-phosphatase HisJ family protein [Atopobium fossor]|uniref:histidinol-phosphatase HisJ family protein n=1 Tax=Atopobium fossor TaxID=39487 RepID=UPI000411E523|nr:histidinol-phosphatase HisJ family protein [Atopobium fossor]